MAYSKVILNGTTLMDVTQDTVDAANLLSGETATKNSGAKVTGTYTPPTFSTQSKTVTPSTTSQTVQPDSGYDGLSSVTVNAMPSGSASTPATSITANPSISVSLGGLITATASASQSVTPTVSAGYVSTGTAGTVTVSGSNTQQLTTQSAQTITPTTQNQTIASGQYLTGAQTILGDANLLAENIKKDVSIFNVVGTLEGGGGMTYDLVIKHTDKFFSGTASKYTVTSGSVSSVIQKIYNGEPFDVCLYGCVNEFAEEDGYGTRAWFQYGNIHPVGPGGYIDDATLTLFFIGSTATSTIRQIRLGLNQDNTISYANNTSRFSV